MRKLLACFSSSSSGSGSSLELMVKAGTSNWFVIGTVLQREREGILGGLLMRFSTDLLLCFVMPIGFLGGDRAESIRLDCGELVVCSAERYIFLRFVKSKALVTMRLLSS